MKKIFEGNASKRYLEMVHKTIANGNDAIQSGSMYISRLEKSNEKNKIDSNNYIQNLQKMDDQLYQNLNKNAIVLNDEISECIIQERSNLENQNIEFLYNIIQQIKDMLNTILIYEASPKIEKLLNELESTLSEYQNNTDNVATISKNFIFEVNEIDS